MGAMRNMREMIAAVRACESRAAAQKLVRQEVSSMLIDNGSLMEDRARKIVLDNIAYLTGYLERADAARVMELFDVVHPVYGRAEDWPEDFDEMYRTATRKAREYVAEIAAGHSA